MKNISEYLQDDSILIGDAVELIRDETHRMACTNERLLNEEEYSLFNNALTALRMICPETI